MWLKRLPHPKEPGTDSIRNMDGILVDEFALPQLRQNFVKVLIAWDRSDMLFLNIIFFYKIVSLFLCENKIFPVYTLTEFRYKLCWGPRHDDLIVHKLTPLDVCFVF